VGAALWVLDADRTIVVVVVLPTTGGLVWLARRDDFFVIVNSTICSTLGILLFGIFGPIFLPQVIVVNPIIYAITTAICGWIFGGLANHGSMLEGCSPRDGNETHSSLCVKNCR
jgi:hypothetical protein